MEAAGAAHKEEGNRLFKAGEFLKAAASYTKAIKAEPTNHVYYSNRSQAFLKLSKVGKALEDAEKCIELCPDFVKGYHRKASALFALGDEAKSAEAVEVILSALEAGLDKDNDLVRLGVQNKGKAFVKLADARRKGTEDPPQPEKENGPSAANEAAAVKAKKLEAAATPPQAAIPAPAKPQKHLYELDPEEFAGAMIQDVFDQVLKSGEVPTIVYMQPSPPKPGAKEEPGLAGIGIDHAFNTPATLGNCADFIRKHAGEQEAQSAMIIVRKSHVGYPCVWKGKPKGVWKFGKADGIFMQLEAKQARAMFFTELKTTAEGKLTFGETAQIDVDEFALFPRIFPG
ncbi:hypothetical protein AB1Y20_015392 [Prymnesium parvum]|uniref:RNA-polymerase II-associated protein 3-like C-terminal domain-containing protein n=1 Tax=Prymnesium parvum TaxID=97485 RepID=A0AB34K1A1_PRYPA